MSIQSHYHPVLGDYILLHNHGSLGRGFRLTRSTMGLSLDHKCSTWEGTKNKAKSWAAEAKFAHLTECEILRAMLDIKFSWVSKHATRQEYRELTEKVETLSGKLAGLAAKKDVESDFARLALSSDKSVKSLTAQIDNCKEASKVTTASVADLRKDVSIEVGKVGDTIDRLSSSVTGLSREVDLLSIVASQNEEIQEAKRISADAATTTSEVKQMLSALHDSHAQIENMRTTQEEMSRELEAMKTERQADNEAFEEVKGKCAGAESTLAVVQAEKEALMTEKVETMEAESVKDRTISELKAVVDGLKKLALMQSSGEIMGNENQTGTKENDREPNAERCETVKGGEGRAEVDVTNGPGMMGKRGEHGKHKQVHDALAPATDDPLTGETSKTPVTTSLVTNIGIEHADSMPVEVEHSSTTDEVDKADYAADVVEEGETTSQCGSDFSFIEE